jgi:hypothetical protein
MKIWQTILGVGPYLGSCVDLRDPDWSKLMVATSLSSAILRRRALFIPNRLCGEMLETL